MKIASAAATESATTSRAGLRLRPTRQFYGRLLRFGRGSRLPLWDPIPVVVAERPGRVLGQRVAVALAVGGAHERGYDLDVPLGDVAGLPPQVGETQVDVQLEQVDAGGVLGHAARVRR